jgi:hypothetical protein
MPTLQFRWQTGRTNKCYHGPLMAPFEVHRTRRSWDRRHWPSRDRALTANGHTLARLLAISKEGELDLDDRVELARVVSQVRTSRRSERINQCIADNLIECCDCNCYMAEAEYTNPGGDDICESCMDNCTDCHCCNTLVYTEDTYNVGDEHSICTTCIRNHYFCCISCDEHYDRDNGHDIEGHGRVCGDCAEDHYYYWECDERYHSRPEDDPSRFILPYNVTRCGPIGNVPDDRSVEHVMGIELEVESPRRDAFAKAIGDRFTQSEAHCKSDSSLSSGTGVEVVTGWGTLETMVPMVNEIVKIARAHGSTSHDNSRCGLHIGLDRSDLNHIAQAQLVAFWNHPNNYKLLKSFARRNFRSNSYCRTAAEKSRSPEVNNAKLNGPDISDKYSCVNTGHDSHLEFRAFRGSLAHLTVEACMSMTSLLTDFCMTDRVPDELITTNFVTWLLEQEEDMRLDTCNRYLSNRGTSFMSLAATAGKENAIVEQEIDALDLGALGADLELAHDFSSTPQ